MEKFVWLPPFALGLIWEIVGRSGIVNPFLFPPLSKVMTALWDLARSGIIFADIGQSLWRLILGLAIGLALGVVLGVATGRFRLIATLLSPIIQLLRPLPPVAILPLIIVWFGIGDWAKVFLVAFAAFFPVWVNTHAGAEQIPKEYIWSAQLLSGSKPKIFQRVIFPAVLPFAVAGIRVGIALGFIMVFVSELAGASGGLGYRISVTQLSYRMDEMIAALIVLAALGALVDQLFALLVRRIFPWLKFDTI